MKNIILILFCVLFISTNYGQNKSQLHEIKDNKKVDERDSLDIVLNKLIDANGLHQNRDISFPNFNKWRDGEIYILSGDTLIGEIKNVKHQGGQTSMVLYYRENENSKKQRYRADKLLGFKVDDREYKSRRFSDLPPSYIEIIEKGTINLYLSKHKILSGHSNPAKNMEHIYLDMMYEFYIESNLIDKKELTGPIPLTEKKFINMILEFIEDYPELKSKISSQHYSFWHLLEIVQLYNKHTATQ